MRSQRCFFNSASNAGVERAGVTGGDVLAHVFRVAHAHDRRAHCGMREDEAQATFLAASCRLGTIFFSFSTRRIVFARFSGPKYRAPIVLREARFKRHLAAQAAFVERHARDYAYVEFLAQMGNSLSSGA